MDGRVPILNIWWIRMAEIAVGVVTDKLIPLLRDELKLLKGVRSQVEWVKDELLLIQAFLKDADAKTENSSEPNDAVKEWVKQLREVAFRIEDVVDLYLLKVAKRHHGHPHGFVAKVGFFMKSIMSGHEISSNIDGIKGNLRRLAEVKETLGLSPNTPQYSVPNAPESKHGLRMGAHYIDDDQLVGVDHTRELLTHWILTGECRRTVIAVVGEGGLGKTTIVKNVYKKQKERKSFECYAWITVSRWLKEEHLLKTIMQDLYEEDGNRVAAKEISETVMPKDALCGELNFSQVMKNEESKSLSRRISFHGNFVEHQVESYRSNYGQIRSCFACDIEELTKPVVEMLLCSFKLLVALDFENSPLDHLPESIGMLLNLKYVNLRNTQIKIIPKFIAKLRNLETLDLRGTTVHELPKEINKLTKLRHLLVYSSLMFYRPGFLQGGMKLNKGVGCLTALQSLTRVDTTDGDDIIEELKNLKNMRQLGININKRSGNQVCSMINNMTHLCSLLIVAADVEEHEGLELQSLVDPPPFLQRLYLDGHLGSLPKWIAKLKSLVVLRLAWSGLTEDPIPVLKNLPDLVDLMLHGSYEGAELHFQEGLFTKLKILTLQSLPNLRALKLDEKALPHLESLFLGPCPQMVQEPTLIQNLESLKSLTLTGMPRHVVENIKRQLKDNIKLYVRRNL
ncbi:hypothetical protein RJT34_10724 [Clitoria ternatea]|uniref:Uncharacterized protein n=1 Tax=Clitoria ternatea TaxID=43366 RepID=A0AAN9JIK6_CLITE